MPLYASGNASFSLKREMEDYDVGFGRELLRPSFTSPRYSAKEWDVAYPTILAGFVKNEMKGPFHFINRRLQQMTLDMVVVHPDDVALCERMLLRDGWTKCPGDPVAENLAVFNRRLVNGKAFETEELKDFMRAAAEAVKPGETLTGAVAAKLMRKLWHKTRSDIPTL